MRIGEDLKINAMNKEFIKEVLNSCAEGILILDDRLSVRMVNHAASVMLGSTSAGSIDGQHINDVCGNYPHKSNLLSALEKSTSTDNDNFSVTVKEAGEGIWSIIRFNPCLSPEETRMYHQALEKSNKELDEFAHIVSHDLKAPLRAISNLSLWLQEDIGDQLTGENRDNFSKLRNRVMRMEGLINGILEYSRTGRQKIDLESVDVYVLLQEILEMLAPPPNMKIHIPLEMPTLRAPKVLLLQVFSNLISNAIKYNDKPEGVINVNVEQKEEFYQFTVEDNGPGIPAEFHEKIFLIFQTLQSRDKMESTGIGLTIVKKILATVGGKIWLESEPGKGTRFFFTWPLESK